MSDPRQNARQPVMGHENRPVNVDRFPIFFRVGRKAPLDIKSLFVVRSYVGIHSASGAEAMFSAPKVKEG